MVVKASIIDMHVHSTASDGQLTPTEVVRLAASLGLAGVAITDHDTVAGIKEAAIAAQQEGIVLLPGIEISTVAKEQDIHVLGYFTNNEDSIWLQRVTSLGATRDARNQMLIAKLQELGIAITLQEVVTAAGDKQEGSVGRPHFAQVLMDKGYVANKQEAFDKYLGEQGEAFVQPARIHPIEAYQWIKEAGGVCVLAHPGIYHNNELVRELLEAGVDGVEVNHSDHTTDQIQLYKKWADELDLIETAGSDFHGIDEQGVHFHGQLGAVHKKLDSYEQLYQLHQTRAN